MKKYFCTGDIKMIKKLQGSLYIRTCGILMQIDLFCLFIRGMMFFIWNIHNLGDRFGWKNNGTIFTPGMSQESLSRSIETKFLKMYLIGQSPLGWNFMWCSALIKKSILCIRIIRYLPILLMQELIMHSAQIKCRYP